MTAPEVKPDFLVIGAAKCATSSLCALIGSHPDAFMCDPKEPMFFARDVLYHDRGWAWYTSLFEQAEGCRAIGEGSVHYTHQAVYPDAADRIANHLPDAKLIYIVRHPLEQIVSHWIMLRSHWRALWGDGVRMTDEFNESVRECPILLDTADYLTQIDRYRAHFDDDRILVLFYEDFVDDALGVGNRCFEFLGLEPLDKLTDGSVHLNPSSEKMVDRPYFRPMRLLPGTGVIRKVLPDSVKRLMRPFLRTQIDGKPSWNDDSRAWVCDKLAAPTATFLERYGRPADHWLLNELGCQSG